jgi:DNA-binding transcriptional MerR regulator
MLWEVGIMVYSTSEIAKEVGVHANTVRLYEELKFIPPAARRGNGYRIYTEQHLEQMKFARLALRCEIIQGNLRKEAIRVILTSAAGDYDKALEEAYSYQAHIKQKKANAEEAIGLIEEMLRGKHREEAGKLFLKRCEAAKQLGVSIDVLRNWERNGLLEVPRKINGYRIYTEKEIIILKIIRTLRLANYSMMSILRMLNHVRKGTDKELKYIIDTPDPTEDIVYVTDKFITSLTEAEGDVNEMIVRINRMKNKIK